MFAYYERMIKVTILIGLVGFVIGGYLGFLVRPSAFLIGQLPFETVITRGANLRGIDQILTPLAQQSFSITLVGAIIGSIMGVVIGIMLSKKSAS